MYGYFKSKSRLKILTLFNWTSKPYSSPVLLLGCLLPPVVSQFVYCIGEPSDATYSPLIFAIPSHVLPVYSCKAQINSFSSSLKSFQRFSSIIKIFSKTFLILEVEGKRHHLHIAVGRRWNSFSHIFCKRLFPMYYLKSRSPLVGCKTLDQLTWK